MIGISSDNLRRDILYFVKNWVNFLSENRFEEACALIDEPNYYGVVWTPQLILKIVNETFSLETIFHRNHPEGIIFTSYYECEQQESAEVIRFNDGSGYAFDYNVPLNYERSDLTAQFEFLRRDNGYAVVLQDLHVL